MNKEINTNGVVDEDSQLHCHMMAPPPTAEVAQRCGGIRGSAYKILLSIIQTVIVSLFVLLAEKKQNYINGT